ncbi:DUF4198 domain-containing protein [Bowmanella denitrificans]|uniref:DUF4198 domain-containing protein n=1 Tax=Bowmanella denitrificans TaxID=366582 RepID=A0ABP3H770_9ALTE
MRKYAMSPWVKAFSLAGLMLCSQSALAHARWLVPSHTNLSGQEAHAIALDFSISNDIFHADRSYGSSEDKGRGGRARPQLIAVAPDGSRSAPIAYFDLLRKSAAGVTLAQSGTYRIGLEQPATVFTFYKDAQGERGRVFGGKDSKEIPAGATDLATTRMHARVETYVSRNQTTELKTTGLGLEVANGTHPNDLFTGETVRWQLLQDGKPVAEGTEVMLIRGETRYRNQRGEIHVKADANGFIEVNFDEAGMYLLEAGVNTPSTTDGIDTERASLFLTFEVNPA